MAQGLPAKRSRLSIGFEEQDFSELHHARRVAGYVGAEHHEFIDAAGRDGNSADASVSEHYAASRLIRRGSPATTFCRNENATVALNGDGGDECLAGYERYAAMNLAQRYAKYCGGNSWRDSKRHEPCPSSGAD